MTDQLPSPASHPTPEPFVIADELNALREHSEGSGFEDAGIPSTAEAFNPTEPHRLARGKHEALADAVESRILSEWASQSSRIETLEQRVADLELACRYESDMAAQALASRATLEAENAQLRTEGR